MNTIATAHRYRAIWISDIHLGTPGCQADSCSISCATPRADYALSRRRHHRRLAVCSAAGTGTRATTTWSRRCCARRARARRSIYVPGNHDESLRHFFGIAVRRHRDPRRGDPRDRRRPAPAGHPRRPLRRRGAGRPVARASRRPRLLPAHRSSSTSWFNHCAPRFGFRTGRSPHYLKHKVKNAVSYIGDFEAALAARGAAPRLRRRRLRPHPQGRDPRRSTASSTATTATGSRACTALVEHRRRRAADHRLEWASPTQLRRCCAVADGHGQRA